MTVILSQVMFFNSIFGVSSKASVKRLQYLPTSVENSRNARFVASFTKEMIGNEAGPVLI